MTGRRGRTAGIAMLRHSWIPCLALTAAVGAAAALGAARSKNQAAPQAPAAVPQVPAAAPQAAGEEKSAEGVAFLVLTITGDEEGLGEHVAEMLRFKAKRLGAAVYDPHSIAEALGSETVSPDIAPAKLAAMAREKFQADILVTGHVKGKMPGPYEVRLVAVYADDPRDPRVLDKTWPCGYHQIIPLEMAKAVYEILGLQVPKDPLRMLREDAEAARRWREGPNLVRNPGFETPGAAGGGPADWQPIEKQMAWVANPDGPGKVLKYDMDKATAGSYGLDFYSDWIEIEPGATYRFSCRYKSLGPTPKVFLKGYHPFEASDGYPAQRRETYRRQVHPGGQKKQWNTVEADFVPESTRPDQTPTFLKVDLYAYWPAGVIYWDDIVLKKVRDAPPAPTAAPPAAGAKDPARPVSAPLTAAAPPAAGAAPQAGPGPAAKGSP
jgi:hypothetical protein